MEGYDDLPDMDRDRMLSDSLRQRYRTSDPKTIEKLFHDELGLQPYRIRVLPAPGLMNKINAWGAYQQAPGRIALDVNPMQNNRIATMAHELGHVADDVYATPAVNQGPEQSRLHHSNFRNFEPEMSDSIDQQMLMEMGIPPDPGMLAKYPWLRSVTPRSSNRLASPWAGAKPSLPADIYNGTRSNDTIQKLIEDVHKYNGED